MHVFPLLSNFDIIFLILGDETEALIRINYQQANLEMIPSSESTAKPQRIASLDFNSIDIIGKLHLGNYHYYHTVKGSLCYVLIIFLFRD